MKYMQIESCYRCPNFWRDSRISAHNGTFNILVDFGVCKLLGRQVSDIHNIENDCPLPNYDRCLRCYDKGSANE